MRLLMRFMKPYRGLVAVTLLVLLIDNVGTLLVPTMLVLFILQCGSLLNVGYEKVYALQNATNLTGSEVISTYVYKVGMVQKDFAFSTATGLFNSAVNCVILVLANTLSKSLAHSSLW